jgi:hypothetical protein
MSSINDTPVDELIINELTKTKYDDLLTNNSVNENEIYLVTNDTFDADNNPIVNVGDPENDTDAANKQYVIISINDLSSTVSSNYALKDEILTAEDLGLSNYATVSSVTNISSSLSSYTPLTTSNDISSLLNDNITYVSSQVSSYSLSADVSSTINKVSNIASSLSALSDISQIPAEYTIDSVVQKLNEVIIRINTLTTSLK